MGSRPQHDAEPGTPEEPAGPVRVLVVDDDPDQRATLGRILELEGFDVGLAPDGEGALARLGGERFDVLLLDLDLPGLDGFETCRRLRAGIPPWPAVLFVSAHASLDNTVHGLDLGAADFLAKPYEVAHLLAKVRAAARTQRELARLSVRAAHDSLTGLLARGELEPRGSALVASARRHHRPLACLAVDVDHFKQVNDAHGHLAGDAVLREIAARMRAVVREEDLVLRTGGEEFVVLAPDCSPAAAAQLAERLRRVVREAPVPLGDNGRETRLTVSLGIAAWRPELDLQGLLAEADAALYRAKQSGRDRACQAAR